MALCDFCGVETILVKKVLDIKTIDSLDLKEILSTCSSCSFFIDRINKLYKRSKIAEKELDEVLQKVEIFRRNAAASIKIEGQDVRIFCANQFQEIAVHEKEAGRAIKLEGVDDIQPASSCNLEEMDIDIEDFVKVESEEELFTSVSVRNFKGLPNLHKIKKQKRGFRPICYFCNKQFIYMRDLVVHIKMHTKERQPRRYKCYFCSKLCPNQFELCRHLYTHTKEKILQKRSWKSCYFCKKKCAFMSDLQTHYRIHTLERKLGRRKCYFCFKRFDGNSKLCQHIRTHTTEKGEKLPRQSTSCGVRFQDSTKLARHSRKPCARKRRRTVKSKRRITSLSRLKMLSFYDCYFCLKKIRGRAMRQHLSTHTKESLLVKCPQCGERYKAKCLSGHIKRAHGTERGKRRTEMKAVRKYAKQNNLTNRCYFCGIQMSQKGALWHHLKIAHINEVTLYDCEGCYKQFNTYWNLILHKRMVCFPVPDVKEILRKQNEAKKLNANCYFCKRLIRNKCDLVNHMKAHTMEDCFQCKKCLKIVVGERSFKHHQLINCGKRRAQVSSSRRNTDGDAGICVKCGVFSASLKRHMSYCGVPPEARRNCEKCRILFKTVTEKLVHDRAEHRKEVIPNNCYFCSKRFKVKRDLERHFSTHTKESYKCLERGCGKRFNHECMLIKHKKKRHVF